MRVCPEMDLLGEWGTQSRAEGPEASRGVLGRAPQEMFDFLWMDFMNLVS